MNGKFANPTATKERVRCAGLRWWEHSRRRRKRETHETETVVTWPGGEERVKTHETETVVTWPGGEERVKTHETETMVTWPGEKERERHMRQRHDWKEKKE
ncbi:hypothetical protein PoB_001272400 [Plakobranchus ocellatus]|uniref:Uncharacterized protein n=1 Tax=Plakobranchus ocellatus TaxID=259542 RepID=A0AAV3YT17_9GAST|nr:hypothetical protein PoB_001272400 [Plakobranchus ocellatus]